MTTFLIAHIVIGLIGVMASYAVLMGLLKKRLSLAFLKTAGFAAFLAYITSWVTGGYYYVLRYGPVVKPIIKDGGSPWAHAFFMEAKEHIFLFMPVLAFVLWVLFVAAGARIEKDARFKSAIIALASLVTALGIYVALSGVVISGAH
ncbi:MAG: hypothetical protein COW88_03460 [Candidatus Lloydbacteria bacterium CG22_combo_CG10-13_8_21_14_all_47_15]|uniref:DUF420 domain-containing protein n=1 Tax=Candidatus Lloydbacteria bacterium CG22_combo_CG10-13_8_21_14_all_47_15 TaxID=1974635 RepID=A0A2H0CSY6_9BACT|nr:MAG: hypothetical protein COW88_03460 [Candidatus Lloydbacteria bacterium CG22_combo_CG10-13_8_21_14_all_47_15]